MADATGELLSQSHKTYRAVWVCVLIVALIQVLFSVGFITATSFVVEGRRYFCLFDDAMISMRYAANWAQGHGFVWNPGERVEGYTTPLWTAVMGLCHLPGLSQTHTCLLVQLLGLIVLWLCLIAAAVLARSSGLEPLPACVAVVLTGIYYNLMFFSLFGMETGLLTAMMTFAFADTVSCIRNRHANIRAPLWLAPTVLTRPDVLPVMLLCAASVIIFAAKRRNSAITGLIIAVSIVLVHLIWRHSFYGQWLPNTYYLKLTGWPLAARIRPGIRQTAQTVGTLALPIALAATALSKRGYHRLLLFGCFVFGAGYQTYVGGDAWPLSRFVIPYTPALFILAAEGMAIWPAIITGNGVAAPRPVFTAVLSFLCILNVNLIHWDHLIGLTRPQTTCDNWMNVKYVHAVRKCAGTDATVAVTWGGVFPYFSGYRCIDLFGKCDPYIARLVADPTDDRAGHNKHDIPYSLDTYQPDIVLHFPRGKIDRQLRRTYQPVVVKVDNDQMVFCVYNESSKVRVDRSISWLQLSSYLWETDRANTNFQRNPH